MSEWQKDRETCERATLAVVAAAPNEERWLRACAEFASLAKDRWPAALDRIAELEAEVRTAYARGWEEAKKAAVEAVKSKIREADDGCCLSMTRGTVETLDPDEALDAIRAVKMGEGQP